MQIGFYGAAGEVTGSKHLITTDKGKQLLLDCGLFQGKAANGGDVNRHFGFSPAGVNFLFLSHAHIDHSGLIPRLFKEGFRGKIFCTKGTYALCKLMLADSAHIQEGDLEIVNKRRKKRGDPPLDPLYNMDDVTGCLALFHTFEYNEEVKVDEDITCVFTDVGHMIGSAAVNLTINTKKGKPVRITFTGDIGRQSDKILNSPQPYKACDVLICESTYGDRLHEKVTNADERLLSIVKQTCVEQQGKLIIPAFSVDRTQELVYQLEQMENAGRLPKINIYVDSPLSVNATNIMREFTADYNQEFKDYLKHDPVPFCFRNLHFITKVEESKALNSINEPCIIISASGMAEAGRIKHHIKNNVTDSRNTILIVGYCTPESLGGRLRNGNKMVRIFGEEYAVKAKIEVLDAYSAHADYEEILQYLSCHAPATVKKLFLVHGEANTISSFKQKCEEKGYTHITIPQKGEVFTITN